ncbi:NHL domain-containing protein [Mucilaginibacter pedocola]|nr:MBG domain-containing protein [Mucilaginibacter pedocola]
MRRFLQACASLLVVTAFAPLLLKAQVSAPSLSIAGPKNYTGGTDIGVLSPTNTGGAIPGGLYAQTSIVKNDFYSSFGIVADAAGNVYVADGGNTIQKVTPTGLVTRFVGNSNVGLVNGTGSAATFYHIRGLAIDAAGYIYVTDADNNAIRKVSPYGVVTTLAGNGTGGFTNGTGAAARFNSPGGIAIDANGNLYVADMGNNAIRKVTPSGVVTTLAGNGTADYVNATGTAARFSNPQGVAVDAAGNVYVADAGNISVRKITPAGVVTTLAGSPGNYGALDGTGTAASFYQPSGLAIDGNGNLYLTDLQNNLIRMITSAGVVTTIAGGQDNHIDGVGLLAAFDNPSGIFYDGAGALYISEYLRIRKVSITGYSVSPQLPAGLSFDASTGSITGTPVLAKAATNYTIKGYNTGGSSSAQVSIAVTGSITLPPAPVNAPVISYGGAKSYPVGTAIANLTPTNTGGAVPAQVYGQVSTFVGGITGLAASDYGTISAGIVRDAQGNTYYSETGNHLIRKVTPAGVKSVFAGSGVAGSANGQGQAASFNKPQGLAIDAAGNIYVADNNNNQIRKISPAGIVSTLLGNGVAGNYTGSATSSAIYRPQWVAVDANGTVYATGISNSRVYKISPNGTVSQLANLSNPQGIAVDALFNVYVIDNYVVNKITPDGVVSVLAGSGAAQTTDGQGVNAAFYNPAGIYADKQGNLFVTELYGQAVRRVSPTGLVTTVAGGGNGDGIGAGAGFNSPVNLTGDTDGNLYVVDFYNYAIRKVATTGFGLKGTLPAGLLFDGATGTISGTPILAKAATSYSITAYNAGGSSTATVSIAATGTIAVTPPPVSAPAIAYAGPQSYAAGNAITNLVPTNTGGAVPALSFGQVSTFATVSGLASSDNGTISSGIVMDTQGNVYYTEGGNNLIRKITPAGVKSIFAGSGTAGSANGQGTAARFNRPQGLAIDAAGNIYVADNNNNLIRKITPAGLVSTYAGTGIAANADGPASSAGFNKPMWLAVDKVGSIYVTDNNSQFVRKINPNGFVTTLASTDRPQGIAVDALFNVYVADGATHNIRKISPDGTVSVFAGSGNTDSVDGQGTAASFYNPAGIYIDAQRNLYVSEFGGARVRLVSPTGLVTTVAGGGKGDGLGTAAGFSTPAGLTGDGAGNLYVVDYYANAIRKVAVAGYSLKSILPGGLNFDGATGTISGIPLLAKAAANYTITAYNAGGSSTATVNIAVTGTPAAPAAIAAPVISYAGPQSYVSGTTISALTPSNSGGAIPATVYGQTTTFAGTGVGGLNSGPVANASFNIPKDITVDVYGNVYVLDGNQVIRKISSAGIVSIFAGNGQQGYMDGTGTSAIFNNPAGMATDLLGNLYVADSYNHVIRKITPAGVVTTLAGTAGSAGYTDATGTSAMFNYPSALVVDASRNVYVVDRYNFVIRKISPSGVVTTVAGTPGGQGHVDGTGTAAMFNWMNGIALDGTSTLYVLDDNNTIRKVTTAGVVTTFAGTGTQGNVDGAGTAAMFNNPTGITVDKAGNIYVADYNNNKVRKITKTGLVSTLAGNGTAGFNNGTGGEATFKYPYGIAVDPQGNVYVSDVSNNVIRKITATGYTTDSALPAGLTLDPATGTISGKPTNPQAATTYSITGINGGGSSTATVSIAVTGSIATTPIVAAPQISYAGPKTYPVGTAITALNPANSGGAVPATVYAQISTLTNLQTSGYTAIADRNGNIYVAYSNKIIKLSSAGVSSVLAGSDYSGFANGKGSAASFSTILDMVCDAAGNLYVADYGNQLIRKVSPAGVVTTLAGLAGTSGSVNGSPAVATFSNLRGIAIDASGNVYVNDSNLIRKITPAGNVTTLAGSGDYGSANGTGTSASFRTLYGIAIDAAGNLYVSDETNHDIRKITPAGVVTRFAGVPTEPGNVNGSAGAAKFSSPHGLAIDVAGNLYVADYGNQLIRKITPAGEVSTLVGAGGMGSIDGIGTQASVWYPQNVAMDASGNLLEVDYNNIVRKISLNGYTISSPLPAGLTFDATTGSITGTPILATAAGSYVVTAYNAGGSSSAIVNITVTGTIAPPVNPVAPPAITYASPKTYPVGTPIATLSPTNSGGAVPAAAYARVADFLPALGGTATSSTTDATGNIYYIVANQIFKATPTGAVTLIAGTAEAGSLNSVATASSFNSPQGIAVDAAGNIYVADMGNNLIRKIGTNGMVTTVAGNADLVAGRVDGPAALARFNVPIGIVVDAFGSLFVIDRNNSIIRKISTDGIVSTFAGNTVNGSEDGTGTNAKFNGPSGIAIDLSGNLYVSQSGDKLIRKITPAAVVTTLAGSQYSSGSTDGTGTGAAFAMPSGLATDAAGNVYVADYNTIRKITPAGVVTTLAGNGTSGGINGTGSSASFNYLFSVAVGASGELYATDYNNSIRKVSIHGYTIAGLLPPGLSLDATTGSISGTPLAASAATNYTVTAYNAGGSSTATVNIATTGTIAPPVNPVNAPAISYATPQNYTAGTAVTLSPTNTGGAVPATVYGQTKSFGGALPSNTILGIAINPAGNVAIPSNNQILKVNPNGTINTLAGDGTEGSNNGDANAASFAGPEGMVYDAAGNLYITTPRSNTIRKITPEGIVSTFAGSGAVGAADGPGTQASFNYPNNMAIDSYGNLYVSDCYNNMIRRISPAGLVTTLAGNTVAGSANGTGTSASFNSPQGIAVDASGNVFVADGNNGLIRKITPAGVVTTLAGSGNMDYTDATGTAASFYYPHGLAIDKAGNLYVADTYNQSIRKVTQAGVVTTLAGNRNAPGLRNGVGVLASFAYPYSVAVDTLGNVYAGDTNNQLRVISATGYTLTGTLPDGLAFDGATGTISGTPLVATVAKNYGVTAYNAGGSSTATVNITISGTATVPAATAAPVIAYATPQTYAVGLPITNLSPTNTGGAIPADIYANVTTLAGNNTNGHDDGKVGEATFGSLTGLATDAYGNIYTSENDNYIRKITPSGFVSTVAGNGSNGFVNATGTAAIFSYPKGIAVDKSGNIYVADQGNLRIRKITPAGVVTTFTGNGNYGVVNGSASVASFVSPGAMAIDKNGILYVADNNGTVIRKITTAGVVSTLAGSGNTDYVNGTGTAASFNNIQGLVVDAAGNVYVSDSGNSRIRKVTAAGVVTTLAGGEPAGYIDGTGANAYFNNPGGIAIDGAGNLYLADVFNGIIRKVTPAGVVTTLAGGNFSSADGVGTSANFSALSQVTMSSSGNLYIVDNGNTIRQMSINGYTSNAPLPLGLSFDSKTGIVSGTPTTASAATTYAMTGSNVGGSSTANLNITIIYPPVVTTTAPVTAFASMGDVTPVPVTIDGNATVTDLSKTTLPSASVAITGNFTAGQDVLAFTPNAATMGNIAGSYNASTGVLALTSASSTATLAQWQAALRAVTYNNTNNVTPNVANRTVTFTANDGQFTSLAATKTIALTYTPSSNAKLSSLAVSAGALSPVFAQATNAYTVSVGNSVSSTTVSLVTASANAKVTVNGTAVNSGATSAAIPLNVGANTITTVVTAQDMATVLTYTVTINRNAAQTITFNPLAAVTYGTADYSPGATSTNTTIPITYTSSNTAVATITPSGLIDIVGPGNTVITASQAAGTGYDAATPVARTLVVNPAVVTITAANKSKNYGAANPALTVSYSGFVNGDTQTVLTQQPTISTTATAASAAGTYPITATGATAANYTFNYTAGTLTVGKVSLTITANNQTKTYGAANPALTVAYSGFVNGDTQTSLTTLPAASTTALASSGAGSYPISVSGAASANYNISYVAGTLTIGKANLNITADNKSKVYGSANPALTASYSGFVNGDNAVTLSAQPILSTTATTTSAVGTYPITLSGAASNNYNITYTQGTLTINAEQLTFNPIATQVYGANDFAPGATSASAIIYTSSNTAVATIVSGNIRIVGPGTSTITANNGSSTATQTLTVNPAALTITADNKSKTAGAANPALTVSYSGFVNGDTQASLSTLPVVSTTATTASAAGTYPITVSGAAAAKYTINYVSGTLTVTGSALTFAAIPSKTYGVADFDPGATGSGTISYTSSNTAVATIVSGKIHVVGVGTSTITATSGSSTATQTLTVTRAALVIAAANKTKTYGAANPALTVTYSGFVNSDTQTALSTQPSVSSTATATSAVGTYAITASGAVSANYTISYTAGTLTVGKAALTISADNKTKVAGAANPALTVSYNGFVNSETQTVLTSQAVVTTAATTSSPAGSYGINVSGAAAANYTISYVAGVLTVTVPSTTLPVVSSFTPSGMYNSTIIVKGSNFTGTTAVTLGGKPVLSFTVSSSTQIVVVPGTASASGDLTVTNGSGTVTKAGFVFVEPIKRPALTYVTPQTLTAGTTISPILPSNSSDAIPSGTYGSTTAFAGATNAGAANGTGAAATFNGPVSMAKDASLNIYVADAKNNLIRKITPAGVVTTFAGSGVAGSANGIGTAASFNNPVGLSSDPAGNLYVADKGNNLIRKITPDGEVTTFAGSLTAGAVNATGTAARFNAPVAIATDVTSNIYVAEEGNNLIRKITPLGVVTTLAGSGVAGFVNGTGTEASFNKPAGLAVDFSGSVYVADQANNVIRKILKTGVVSTFAGSGTAGAVNGTGEAASFNAPYGLTIDDGGSLYVADQTNHRIRKVNIYAQVTTIAGGAASGITNSIGSTAQFQTPVGVVFDGKANLYVTDSGNNLVRKIAITGYRYTPSLPAGLSLSVTTGVITGTPTTAGTNTYSIIGYNGYGSSTATLAITVLPAPAAPAISYNGNKTFVVDSAIEPVVPANSGGAIPATVFAQVSTVAGNAGVTGATNGTGTAATFNGPRGLLVDTAGNLFVTDANNFLIRKITPAGVVTTYAGRGTAGATGGALLSSSFNNAKGITMDVYGNIYIGDTGNERIRKITPEGAVSTFVGSSTAGFVNAGGTAARFNSPKGVATDAAGNIFVADQGNYVIRRITTGSTVSTFAGSGVSGSANGTGTAASFSSPVGVAVDGAKNVYVTDGALLRKITSAGVVTTLAGGAASPQDGTGTAAGFTNLTGICIDRKGNLYVIDVSKIRKVTPAGVVTTIAGSSTDGAVNGVGTAALFGNPYGIATDNNGYLYVADTDNQLIRKIAISGFTITPALPAGLVFDSATGTISGTPVTAQAATSYQVTGYGPTGSSTTTLSIAINNPTVVKPLPPAVSYASQTYTKNVGISPLTPSNPGGAVPASTYALVSNYAGGSTQGSADGADTLASFKQLAGLASDTYGNVYVADRGNNKIRKVTPGGNVVTIAGTGVAGATNGTAASASFNAPSGLVVDNSGNIYVADANNNMLRKITAAGVVSTFASGLNYPTDVAIDNAGNLFVAEGGGTTIKKITPAGVVSTFANGFQSPFGVAVDAANYVYVADFNMRIYKVSPTGVVTVLAGSGATGAANGIGTVASFSNPNGLKVDAAGNVYVADTDNRLVRKITAAGVVTTLAGSGASTSINGVGTAASFRAPYGIALDAKGNLIVSEQSGTRLRKISISGYDLNPALPAGLSFDYATGIISGTPTAVTPKTTYTILAGNAGGSSTSVFDITVNDAFNANAAPIISYASPMFTKNVAITPLAPNNAGGAVPATAFATVSTYAGSSLSGSADGAATAAKFKNPSGAAFDHAGNLFIVDIGGHVIRKIAPDGTVVTFAGNGAAGAVNATGTAARFSYPVGVAIDANDNLFITDRNNQLIRKVTPAGVVTTYAGNGTIGAANGNRTVATFSYPTGITIDAAGNLYVADSSNGLIRKITPAGIVSTLAGSGVVGSADGVGTAASFNDPRGIAVDSAGTVYVSEYGSHRIRKISPAGVVSTYAGSGTGGTTNGDSTSASFLNPVGLAVDRLNNLYVADYGNSLIRKITPTGMVSTLAGKANASVNTTDAVGTAATFYQPYALTIDAGGSLFVADYGSHRVRKVLTKGYALNPTPALPAGLSFNATTGTFTGTPTTVTAATAYTVSAYNNFGSSTATFNITVSNPPTMAASPAKTADKITVVQSEAKADPELGMAGPKLNPALSPNGDGVNDVLRIDNIENYPDNRVMLMDKNGKSVYEVSGYDNSNKVFDGHAGKSGVLLPAGTYFYMVEYRVKGELKRKTGYFVIKY